MNICKALEDIIRSITSKQVKISVPSLTRRVNENVSLESQPSVRIQTVDVGATTLTSYIYGNRIPEDDVNEEIDEAITQITIDNVGDWMFMAYDAVSYGLFHMLVNAQGNNYQDILDALESMIRDNSFSVQGILVAHTDETTYYYWANLPITPSGLDSSNPHPFACNLLLRYSNGVGIQQYASFTYGSNMFVLSPSQDNYLEHSNAGAKYTDLTTDNLLNSTTVVDALASNSTCNMGESLSSASWPAYLTRQVGSQYDIAYCPMIIADHYSGFNGRICLKSGNIIL